jgi:mono/diheme cytochrome c family protein
MNTTRFTVLLGALIAVFSSGANLAAAQAQGTSTNAVWTAPARAARKQNPVAGDPTSLTKGKELYTAGCLPCHGPGGKGDGPAAATLERNGVRVRPGNLSDPKRWEESDGALFWKITEGNSPMPSWGPTLTDEQRWSIVNYIRTLAPKPAGNNQTNKPGDNR